MSQDPVNNTHIYALIETEVSIQVRRALHAERQRLHARLLSAAKGLGDEARAAVEAVAGAFEEES